MRDRVIRLEQNYRSTKYILEAASTLVSRNKERKGKWLWTAQKGGELIGLAETADGEQESLLITNYSASPPTPRFRQRFRSNGSRACRERRKCAGG